jgi:putative ABC transport system ATP-binding protein
MNELIKAVHVTKFPSGSAKNSYTLNDINIEIKTGDFVAITGSVEAEKTALLRLLCLRDKPDRGSIFFTGVDTGALPRSLQKNLLRHIFGTVFQDDTLYSRISVLKNVALPLLIQKKNPREALARSHEILKEFGMEKIEDTKAKDLTKEQKKMSLIAKTVVKNIRVLIADEVTKNLTAENSIKVVHYFQKINKDEKITIIIATNDDVILGRAHKIIRI